MWPLSYLYSFISLQWESLSNHSENCKIRFIGCRDVFFPPFKPAIQEGSAMNVMATYNELWGMPAHINKHLLTDILRKERGFNGVVVSDYFAGRALKWYRCISGMITPL
ncbi:MAG: hypothetical protein KTQ13_10825 [Ferruginibacter sp.]|nr:hypothetical protein [Ferruginibacter sp.]MBU9937137.1 hypothetical protein [Ferruginibacter sp.]